MQTEGQSHVREQVARILASPTFARKSMVPALLSYIVEKTLAGETKDLTERVIAKKVFGETFFSGEAKPSTVRVHASNLREALFHYYSNEGLNDELLVNIPKGAYVATFLPRNSRPADTPRRRSVMLIEAEFNVFDNLIKLEGDLQRIAGDPTLRIVQLRIGSVFVEFDSTESAYDLLQAAFQDGKLVEISGFPVSGIVAASTFSDDLRAKRRIELQSCYSPVVHFRDQDPVFVWLDPSLSNVLTGDDWLFVDIFISNDGMSWRQLEGIKESLRHFVPGHLSEIRYSSVFWEHNINNVFLHLVFRLDIGGPENLRPFVAVSLNPGRLPVENAAQTQIKEADAAARRRAIAYGDDELAHNPPKILLIERIDNQPPTSRVAAADADPVPSVPLKGSTEDEADTIKPS